MLRLTDRARALAAAALVLATACGSPSAAATRSGVTGTVLAGPTCPVETPESPCPDRPVADALVRAKGEGTTTTTRTDAFGMFRLRLRPGLYALEATSDSVFGCEDERVRVVKRRFTEATINCDTGIR